MVVVVVLGLIDEPKASYTETGALGCFQNRDKRWLAVARATSPSKLLLDPVPRPGQVQLYKEDGTEIPRQDKEQHHVPTRPFEWAVEDRKV